MKESLSKSILLVFKFLGLLVLYTAARLLFYFFNHQYFSDLSIWNLLYIMLCGIRFDASVIVLSNSVFLLLYLLPLPFRDNKIYKNFLQFLFITVNSLAMLANCVDLVYFQFTLKRTTSDVFNFFGGGMGNDLGRLLPTFLKDYWYLFVIWAVFTYFVYRISRAIEQMDYNKWTGRKYLFESIIYLVSIGFYLIIYRGGLQLKPISEITAGEYVAVKYVPLMVNTPFTIMKTLDVEGIEPMIYYKDEAAMKRLYNPMHKGKAGEFKKLNVFIIALESFSKEYIGALNHRPYDCTPFLDSIIDESLTFPNAFSNGKRSIEGIPAIVAGIPSWTNEPYLTSRYGTNTLHSLANQLKQMGYYSAFFHGGDNGTMGFLEFSHLAGYDDYFGRDEYPGKNDYDGNWGIWDEEFLQYTANTINAKKQPFFATVFTLTSHHPYNIPERYNNTFNDGQYEISKSIEYTDYSLKKFFETAKKMPWFNNTLFIFSADHTGISEDAFYTNRVGNYAIPIIYYLPGSNLKGIDSTVTQQIDIMPSVLDYLNYPKPYFAFGTSVFDSTATHYALSMNNATYQYVERDYTMQLNREKADDLYNYKVDTAMKYDLRLKESTKEKVMESKAKAIIQTYQQSLINNKMH